MEALNRRPKSPPKSRGELQSAPSEWPSGHYPTVSGPSKVMLSMAAEPPHPVLPKQPLARQLPKTMRERMALASSLTGAGRAGKPGCLQGSSGSKYEGQVMAGRPHGKGQYFAPPAKPGGPLRLVYEGDFVKGSREGQGICYYYSGEIYEGSWVQNRRMGPGRLTYVDGSMYDGMWLNDRRHGVGTFYSTNGDAFVGTFSDDKRHGLGTTYMPGRGKKYVAEYVCDSPTCGSFFEIDVDTVEAPPTQQLRGTITAATLRRQMNSSQPPGQLPALQLAQPSKVLAKEFVAVRQLLKQLKAGTSDYTLPADSMSLLRHAFILVAGGDDSAAFVLPHQLQELVVLAGLDPAAPPVVKLMGLMQERAAGRAAAHGEAKLYLDEFLGVVCFFREKPLEVLQHEQGKQAAAEAAMKAAAAAAVCWGDDSTPGAATGSAAGAAQGDESGAWQQQDGLAEEVWQQDNEIAANEEAKQATAATRLSEPGWGAAGDELMLERHIAQHRGSSASHSAATAAEPGYAAAAAAGPVEAMPGLASTADTEVAGQPGSVFEGAGQPGSV